VTKRSKNDEAFQIAKPHQQDVREAGTTPARNGRSR
jgi:hypothetical protein